VTGVIALMALKFRVGPPRTTSSAPCSTTPVASRACSRSIRATVAAINARSPASGFGVVSGVPDVVVIMNGVPFALELKTESGKLSAD
jgi:hypothetical protein